MKVGTKSVLFGVHAFWWHPIVVAISWVKLYDFPWDPRIWIAFFVHDLGYFGCPNMDGEEGEKHPEFGAKIMHVFDKWKVTCTNTRIGSFVEVKREFRSFKWHDFSLYHSRFYAKKAGAFPSKLCFADKLSVCYDPYWFYMLRATLSGEIKEYLSNGGFFDKWAWFQWYRMKMIQYVSEIKDQEVDTRTKERKFETL
jgi:hypothetical protein